MINKITEITSLISNEMNTFEINLRKIIEQNDNFLKDYLCDFIFGNAKFLRPKFTFLFSKILKIEDEKVMKIALIAELLHNASLLHDDIIDESKTRRNLLTFNEKFNTKIALLEGDYLLSLAMKVLVETDIEIMKIFSTKILNTIQGEIKQNENANKIPDIETYFEKTFNKTGNIFFSILESLFLIKNTGEKMKDILRNYLLNFCYAFQLQNDIKDVEPDSSCGNYTLPMIYFFMENKKIPKKEDISLEIEKAKKVVEKYKKNAKEALFELEESIYKKALEELIINI